MMSLPLAGPLQDSSESVTQIKNPFSSSLSFNRTVPRDLVHRRSVSQVFLTDIKRMTADRVRIGAQLPTSHAFFHDHVDSDSLDSLLLMEICRQANLATAHVLEVPRDTVLVSQEFHISEISTELPFNESINIEIDSEFEWTKFRRGIPRAGECRQCLYVNNMPICRYSGKGVLIDKSELENLRRGEKVDAVKFTDSFSDVVHSNAVPPQMVGRRDPLNVVLSDLSKSPKEFSAVISPRWTNKALFDHSYDHLTMQVVIEACRQIALIAYFDYCSLSKSDRMLPSICNVFGSFKGFAELDSPAYVKIRYIEDRNYLYEPLIVRVSQQNQLISTVGIQYSRRAD